MSTINPDSLREIALTVNLGKQLTLIVVFGPGYLAADGLAEIRDAVQSSGPVVEHRVDRLGPDIADTVAQPGTARPNVLVSGLERMADEPRAQALASMNLLRDTLSERPAAVILWIPSESADEFRRACVDLFHWRALSVYVDAPADDERRVRHAYLVSLASATADYLIPVTAVPELEVRAEGVTATQSIDKWLDTVRRGILLGLPGSGKTTSLVRYAVLRAEDLLDGARSELPIFVAARRIARGRALADAVLPELDENAADWLTEQLDSGPAVLLVDGLDELTPDQQELMDEQLLAFVAGKARLRVVLATRPHHRKIPGDWQRAWVQPLRPSASAAMLRSLGCDAAATVDTLEWADAEVFLTTPSLFRLVAAHARRAVGRELDLTAVLDDLVIGRLGLWDADRGVVVRSTRSSSEARRQLVALASPTTRPTELDSATLDFVAERSGLIRKEQADSDIQYTFTHHAFRDYFVADGFSPDELVVHAADPTCRVATMHALRLLGPRERVGKAEEIWLASVDEPPSTRWAMRMIVLRAMLADRNPEVRTRFIERAKLALQQAQRDGDPSSAWTPVAKLIERVDQP